MKGSDIKIGEEYAIAVPANKYTGACRGRIVNVKLKGERQGGRNTHVEFEPLDDPGATESMAGSPESQAHRYRMTIAADGIPVRIQSGYAQRREPKDSDRVAFRAPHGNVIGPWAEFVPERRVHLLRAIHTRNFNDRNSQYVKAIAEQLNTLAGGGVGSGFYGGSSITIDKPAAAKLIEMLGETPPELAPMPERFAELFEDGKEPSL